MKVLIVGQTPPPLHGQAIMIQALLDAEFPGVQTTIVRMNFSQDVANIGKPTGRKVKEMFRVIRAIRDAVRQNRPEVLYYAPGGATLSPVIRDFVILAAVRRLFPKTIFHFHAGGLRERFEKLPGPVQGVFKRVFGKPDVAIRVSPSAPDDGAFLEAISNVVVSNGVICPIDPRFDRAISGETNLLFVGVLSEDKGIFVALEALKILIDRGVRCRLAMMGIFANAETHDRAHAFVTEQNLPVDFLGSLIGDEKWRHFADADVFVFPSFFAAETFGMVVVEAMAAGLPVVTTRWRGIPDIVQDGVNGLLVPIQDPTATADALGKLIADQDLRERFAVEGRQSYEDHYTLAAWQGRMAKVFDDLKGQK